VMDVIPRSAWQSLILANQGKMLSDLIKQDGIKCKDQDGLNYCWGYGSTETVEVLRSVEHLPYVELSPESVAGPIVNWRNVGGFAEDACSQLNNFGACATSFMDAPNSLRHTSWKEGWEANALLHKIEHSYVDIGSFDELVTACLNRIPCAVGLDWWGHLVMIVDAVILPDGTIGVMGRNSWGADWPNAGDGGWFTLSESKAQPSGAFGPRVVTLSAA